MSKIRGLLAETLHDTHSLAILGCGSALLGDDAAGMQTAERLQALGGNVRVFCGSTAPENFTGEIKSFRPDALLVIDAAELAKPPGTVALIPPDKINGATFSTHMLPLSIMLDYLRSEINCRVCILGIQGRSFEFGAPLTTEVNDAVDDIVSALISLFSPASD